jgi:hypothetical protein
MFWSQEKTWEFTNASKVTPPGWCIPETCHYSHTNHRLLLSCAWTKSFKNFQLIHKMQTGLVRLRIKSRIIHLSWLKTESKKQRVNAFLSSWGVKNTSEGLVHYPRITYSWTVHLILYHSYLVGNLKNSTIAKTKALEPLKSWHFCISNFRTC